MALAAASTVLLLGACMKMETDSNRVAVSFSTYNARLHENVSRAGDTYVAPGQNFAAGAEIGVFGFYHDNTTWAAETSAGTNKPDFMYDQLVVKQNDGSWSYSPVKYWPNEYGAGASSTDVDKLSFWAYYPYNASGLSMYEAGSSTAYSNTSTGIPKLSFVQAEDPDNQIDLMFSGPVTDLYKTMAHTVNTETWNYGVVTNGQVTLPFKHALALVEFQLTEGTGAKINNLTLTNIKKSGTLENPASIPFTWSNVGGSYTIHKEDVEISTNAILTLLAMPQTLSADATFTLNYDITFASSDPTHPEPIVYTGDSFSVKLFKNAGGLDDYGVTEWIAGKHYIYKVTAGLDRIEFEEVVESSEDWTINTNISVPE